MYADNMISAAAEERRTERKVSRKRLIPVFIMEILEKNTDYRHPCSQKFIREMLLERYGLCVERKAVSKHIHTMLMEDLCIFGDEKTGYWYDGKAYLSGRVWERQDAAVCGTFPVHI